MYFSFGDKALVTSYQDQLVDATEEIIGSRPSNTEHFSSQCSYSTAGNVTPFETTARETIASTHISSSLSFAFTFPKTTESEGPSRDARRSIRLYGTSQGVIAVMNLLHERFPEDADRIPIKNLDWQRLQKSTQIINGVELDDQTGNNGSEDTKVVLKYDGDPSILDAMKLALLSEATPRCAICIDQAVLQTPKAKEVQTCDQHVFCMPCLIEWFRLASRPPFGCPGCSSGMAQTFPIQNLKDLLSEASLRALASRTLDRYIGQQRHKLMWCPRAGCSHIIRIENHGGLLAEVQCPGCFHYVCVPCRASHSQMSCDDYKTAQVEEDRATAQMMKDREGPVKACPGCQQLTCKDDGCDHVQCDGCGIFWCFDCSYVLPDGADDHWWFREDIVHEHDQKHKLMEDHS